MRALRVVGITEGGGECSVVLEDSLRRERFTVPADEQLRAAARGDLTRLGQIAIELESQLRPREIQARIRAGASVEQVAAAAGVPMTKIERFAYPVLLERSRTAEVAQRAHPLRADGPDRRMLGDVVAYTFGLRGQEYQAAEWDSWKGEDGRWVVALSWRAGRSDNRALWAFQPGAHGGTVTAIDEHAHDLIEGLPVRPLRTVGPVIDISRPDEPAPTTPPQEGHELRAAASDIAARRDLGDWARPPVEPRRADPPRRATRPEPAEPPSRVGRDDEPRHRSSYPAPRVDDPADDPRRGVPEHAEPAARVDEPATDRPTTEHRSAAESTDDGTPTAAAPASTSVAPTAAPTTPLVEPTTPPAVLTTTSAESTTTPAPPSSNAPEAPTATPSVPTPDAVVAPDAPDHFFATPPPAAAEQSPKTSSESVDASPADSGASAGGSETTTPEPTTPAATPAPKRTRKGKPVMPSWDEVLLGVRSQR